MAITNDRALHMLGVARRAAHLAPIFNVDPKAMWLAGWLHDIGYEFADDPSEHGPVAADFLWPSIIDEYVDGHFVERTLGADVLEAIELHGNPNRPQNPYVLCLNVADMTTSPNGQPIAMGERLADIADRYGITSKQYADAARLGNKLREKCAELGVPATVFAGTPIPGGWHPSDAFPANGAGSK